MGLDFDFDKLFKKEKEHTALEIIGIIIGIIFGLALAFGLLCLEAWICMLLWNWFVVDMLGLTQLYMANIWYMWGVRILFSILFKSHNYNSKKKD